MNHWLNDCEAWVAHQYQVTLGLELTGNPVRLRWFSAESLTNEVVREVANSLAIEDADIGLLLFLLPYDPDRLEQQVNHALGMRSRLLRESNFTGNENAGAKEDTDSTWRIGLVWLVESKKWADWQRDILELRRESGAAEEISFDVIRIEKNGVTAALAEHRLPRLLLHTRALLKKSITEAETWLSADVQVSTALKNFSQQFKNPRARTLARELEEKVKSFQPKEKRQPSATARQFQRFRVKHFRNLDALEIVADQADDAKAQAIVLFGPNGTGKSSFTEALSLATFHTSPQLERFIEDEDVPLATASVYLRDYLTPLSSRDNPDAKPSFSWGNTPEVQFELDAVDENKSRYEGVVLNQEDSIKFTDLSSKDLAARVLKGYSVLTDHLSVWLEQEERRANETKLAFTRKHHIVGQTKLSSTAYKGLAQTLLLEQLQRPSPEFLNRLRSLERLTGEDGKSASRLVSEWTTQQENVVKSLAETLAKFQQKGASQSQIVQAIREKLNDFDRLAKQSNDFRRQLENRSTSLHEQIDVVLAQIESWGVWLASQADVQVEPVSDSRRLKIEIESLTKEQSELENKRKVLQGRLDLLSQAKQFIVRHWAAQHPNTCPVCDTNVTDRQGIDAVISALQDETSSTIQALMIRYIEMQNQQKDLGVKLMVSGLQSCPLDSEDQIRLRDWLQPFLHPTGTALEQLLIDPQRREQLKADILQIKVLPEAPRPYANAAVEAERLANDFIGLAQEADRALEDPQSIGELKKAFELFLENVLINHLPSTLGEVWQEITLVLTTASWLLPDRPTLKLEQRGKSLSVQSKKSSRFVRYLYNAAERHALGLAWYFTYYIAKKRFDEAWILLDDPAQEMDQPSFRELVRFWETLLRLHKKMARPFTIIVALHQERRALDTTRATNGRLYVLGWQKEQEDASNHPSVKKIVLLAPGFHPLKPEKIFG